MPSVQLIILAFVACHKNSPQNPEQPGNREKSSQCSSGNGDIVVGCSIVILLVCNGNQLQI